MADQLVKDFLNDKNVQAAFKVREPVTPRPVPLLGV